MKKTRIFALILILIMVVAILTNPSAEEQKQAVQDKTEQLIHDRLGENEKQYFKFGMQLFGNDVVKEFIQNSVSVKNYYLFSVITLRWQGKTYPIGGGAFKQVYISKEVDQHADQIVETLKNYNPWR